jgi:methyl-accepting chemotaxis protein
LVSINASMLFREIRIMNTDRKLGEVAANLDDMSDTIEEIKDAVHDGGTPSTATLDDLQQDMEEASDAIDDVVDREQSPKS